MAVYLQRDILIEIFLRATVKTLVFCSSTCKTWRDIITDSRFITNHLTRTHENNKSKKPLFLTCYPYPTTRYDDEDSDSASDLVEFVQRSCYKICETYADFNKSYWNVLGSCNGLVLLSYYSMELSPGLRFVIFNPSIESLIHVPAFGTYRNACFSGMGFDSISSDYKVVIFSPEEILCIYSLNTNSWKEVKYEERHLYPTDMDRPVFMNGALHWIARSNIVNGVYDYLILRFDVSREVFDTMCLPLDIKDNPYLCIRHFSFVVFLGKLCFGYSDNNWHYCVWIMTEYGVAESWTMLCQLVEPKILVLYILGSHSNGELIMQRYDGQIVSCDPNSNRVKNLAIRNNERCFYIDNFVESLVLFGSKKTVDGQLDSHQNSNPYSLASKARKQATVSDNMPLFAHRKKKARRQPSSLVS